jgi:hypothetical protein
VEQGGVEYYSWNCYQGISYQALFSRNIDIMVAVDWCLMFAFASDLKTQASQHSQHFYGASRLFPYSNNSLQE